MIARRWEVNSADGLVVRHASEDVESLLDANKRRFNTTPETGTFAGDGFHLAARIPRILIEKWLNEEGINFFDKNDWPKIVAKLNSSEYSYLKTLNARL